MYPILDGALSDTAATGLILGGGAVGCGLLVLGLTVMAIRRGARAETLERQAKQRLRATARSRSKRAASASGTAVDELGAHDPYPTQPYSAHEPASHKPYSRPYRVPKQDSHVSTNGHHPPDSATAAFPTTPFPLPDDDS